MEGKVYLIHRVVVQVKPAQVARGKRCSVGVVWLMDCCQLVWVAFKLPSFIAVAVSRMLHVREVDAVLFVFDEGEVSRENSGLFDVVGDTCRKFFDGVDSVLVLVASRLEVCVDHVKVAHGWVLKVDSHEPALVYVVDVLVCDRVEGLKEVVADECQEPLRVAWFRATRRV